MAGGVGRRRAGSGLRVFLGLGYLNREQLTLTPLGMSGRQVTEKKHEGTLRTNVTPRLSLVTASPGPLPASSSLHKACVDVRACHSLPVFIQPFRTGARARPPNLSWKLELEGESGAALPTASRWQTCPSQELELELGLRWKANRKKTVPSWPGGTFRSHRLSGGLKQLPPSCAAWAACQGVPGVGSRPTHFVDHWIHPQKEAVVKCGHRQPKHQAGYWGTKPERLGQ